MMVVAGSLHYSHRWGFCKNQQHNNQFRSVTRYSKLHISLPNLSSLASRQDSWSINLSDQLRLPLGTGPHRCNLLKCQSFFNPGDALNMSTVKNGALAFSSALQGRPFILKLLPAVGFFVFAVWGLGPVMRQSRNIFLHKSDNSWKKSSTHYFMTSYLQPLLLWAGAALVCRALDPVVLPTEASQIVKQRLLTFVRSLSTVLAFAFCLSSAIQQAQKFFVETNDTSDTRNMGFQFAGKAIYTAVWVAAVSLFIELLGFSTQKWLTAGGLGTVLLTLAGREIFTNFLSSVMIHASRPFVMNEWIQTKIEGYEVSGTVEHVGWWSPTIIRGEDREAVHIPNHKFTVNVVRNLSQKTHWRIKTHLAISHLDVNKINNIVADMRKVLAKNPQVEQQRLHRRVFLENVNPENQALLILVSCFVKTSHFEEYLCVKEAILLDLLRVISHHRARLATPIRTVQKIYNDSDMEGIPFADTFFTRGGVASNHPLLLIEPNYKINGEDKTKAQPRSTRMNGEQDSKVPVRVDGKGGTTPSSDSKAKERTTVKENNDTEAVAKVDEKLNKVTEKPTAKSVKDSKFSELSITDDHNLPHNSSSEKEANTSGEKQSDHASPLESRRESEKIPVTRPAMEDNIVLGVALEGSKRTLPIDDEASPKPTLPEEKELTACRSGNEKEKKDTKNLNDLASTNADQQN